jgi:hypothetical protein
VERAKQWWQFNRAQALDTEVDSDNDDLYDELGSAYY